MKHCDACNSLGRTRGSFCHRCGKTLVGWPEVPKNAQEQFALVHNVAEKKWGLIFGLMLIFVFGMLLM